MLVVRILIASAALGAATLAFGQQQKAGRTVPTTDQMKARAPAGVRYVPDINYRPGCSACQLDLAYPEAASSTPRPALVVVHGGGWRGGDKRAGVFGELPFEYAQRGYVSISINYRFAGEGVTVAGCVEDSKCAVRWLRSHAKEYNLDPQRFGGFGNSAGAHLVSMLGLAGKEANLEGDGPYQDQSSMIQAVCAAATPTDFLNWGAPRKNAGAISMFGVNAEKMAKLLSPITWAAPSAPPFLLIHGTADTTVPYSQAESMAKALRAAGAKNVTLLAVDAANHGAFASASPMTRSAMMAFFDSTIGSKGKPTTRAPR